MPENLFYSGKKKYMEDGISEAEFVKSTLDATVFCHRLGYKPRKAFFEASDDGNFILTWQKNGFTELNIEFDGSFQFGYAYRQDGFIIPGKENGHVLNNFPQDLRKKIEELEERSFWQKIFDFITPIG